MIETLIYIFILSASIQIVFSAFIYKTIFNPILYFNILFFLHNWSYSFGTLLYPDSIFPWRAYPSVSYETQPNVLLLNLIGLWTLFLTFIALTIRRRNFNKQKYGFFKSLSLFPLIYFIFTFSLLVKLYLEGAFSAGFIYGQGQALTSKEAFSPLEQILGLRVAFASAYLIIEKNKNKFLTRLIFLCEILFTFLEGGRKVLVMLIISALIPYLESSKLNFVRFFRIASLSFIMIYLLVAVTFFRSTDNSIPLIDRINDTNSQIVETGELVTFLIINLANSEGVQNWTYQLVENNELDYSYGKSYFQAFLNMFLLRPFQGNIADMQAAYVFKYAAYPETDNQGYDYSFTAESILNWGSRYAFISYFFLGLFSSYIYNRRLKNDFYKLIYYALWPIFFIYFRSDSTAVLRALSFYIFIGFLAIFNIKRLKLHFLKTHT